jgi:hypothetical protein
MGACHILSKLLRPVASMNVLLENLSDFKGY